MANPIVIDVSHWQPTPDFDAVRAGGTVGVILKATERDNYIDPTYKPREAAARAAGLCTATYHFLRPGKIENQMAFYLRAVQPAPGDRLCIDYEDADVPFADLEQAATYLFDHADCEITVYGSNVLADACAGKTSQILSRTSLWQARYSASEPEVPALWPTWSLWQYTDAAKVSGINGNVDGNKWNGDPAALPGWFQSGASPAPPAPPPVPQPLPSASVEILTKGDVIVILNGQVIN